MPDYTLSNPKNRIVCAAVRFADGFIVCGVRHGDKLMAEVMRATGRTGEDFGMAEEGFVDVFGNFVGRIGAREIARRARQIYWKVDGWENRPELFSEHIYRAANKDYDSGLPVVDKLKSKK